MTTIQTLDMVGTGVFAVAGSLVAVRRKFDAFGALVIAFVSAVGGGTLRDVVLGRPAFWVESPKYASIALVAAFVTFLAARAIARFERTLDRALVWADAAGLGVFSIVGAEKAMAAGRHELVVVMMGVMTGVFGGIIRDVLCNEIPVIFRREIYGIASITGLVAYLGAFHAGVGRTVAVAGGVSIIFLFRMAAVRWGLVLPVLQPTYDEEPSDRGPRAGRG